MSGFSLILPPELVAAIATEVVAQLEATLPIQPANGWLDVDQAAEYLACKPQRVYDLRSQGRVRFAKEGNRLLFKREWLDEAVEVTS